MNTIISKFVFPMVLLFTTINGVIGQEDCSFTLEKAQKLFQEGKIKEIQNILSPCIESGFNSEERVSAYKLIILSYIADDNKDEAQRQMLYFLKKYPEYKLLPTDAVEFQYLYDSYNTFPVFTIGIFGGMNSVTQNVLQQYGTHSLNPDSKSNNSSGSGLSAGLRLTKHIHHNFDLHVEVIYEQMNFESITNNNNYYSVSFDEVDSRLTLPISFTYTFAKVPIIQPYVRFGVAPSKMLNSFATVTGTYNDVDIMGKSGPDVNITNARTKYSLWGLGAIGLRYKIPRGYLFFDVRYNYGFNNNVNSNSRKDEESITVWKYNYVDDDFSLNNLQFTLGYSFIFYKPEKKKK